jgi:MFS family permease
MSSATHVPLPLLSALRQRPFVLLWIGQTTSRLGDRVYEIALAWWVLQTTRSATAMGAVLIAGFLPTVVFVLLGGVLADRIPRVPIMLVSDGLRGALALSLAALALAGYAPLWPVLAVSVCFGALDAFFLPAYSAAVPQLVPPASLGSANALTTISSRAMGIVGPALGAALIAAGGIPLAFALNGGSFVVSTISLVAVQAMRRHAPIPKSQSDSAPEVGVALTGTRPSLAVRLAELGRDLRTGMTVVRSLTWVWLTIALAGLANFVAEGATGVALPYYVQRTLAASPLLYGALTASSAAGAIVAAAWLGSRRARHRGPLIYVCFAIAMLTLTGIGLIPVPGVMLAMMFAYGLCVTALGLAWVHALQEHIPSEKLGRVSSVDQLGSYVFIPLSYAVAGVVVDRIGAAPVLIWSGVVAAAIVSLGFLSRSVRTLD